MDDPDSNYMILEKSPIETISIEDIEKEAITAKNERREPKAMALSSPRSLRACMLEGVLPFQLNPATLKQLKLNSSSTEIAKIRLEYNETKRFAVIKLIKDRRQQIINKSSMRTPKNKGRKIFTQDRQKSGRTVSKTGTKSCRATTSHTVSKEQRSNTNQFSTLKMTKTVERLSMPKKFTKTKPKMLKNNTLTHIDYMMLLKEKKQVEKQKASLEKIYSFKTKMLAHQAQESKRLNSTFERHLKEKEDRERRHQRNMQLSSIAMK